MNLKTLHYEKKVFVMNEWITPKHKNVYIFSGSKTLDVNKFKDKQTNNITNISSFIYDTDTIETIRYKIATMCIKNKNVKDLYMWSKCEVKQDDIVTFAQNLFKNNIKLDKAYINSITEAYFGMKVYSTKMDDKEIYEDFVEEFKPKYMITSLDFRYNNLNDYAVFFSPTPFGKLNETDDESAKTNYLKTLLFKFNLVENEINFVSENTKQDIDAIYFNNKQEYESTFYDLLMTKLKIQDKFGDMDDILDNVSNRLELLYFRVLPHSHDIQINMRTFFEISDTSFDIPFIVYKSKFTNEYKINKPALSDMDRKQIEMFHDQEFKNKDLVLNRANDTIIYYIKLVDNVFFYLLLSENGSYRLKYKLNKANDIKVEDIATSFEKLQNIYRNMDDLMIYKLNKNTEIFNSNMIDIIEYNTQNTLTFKKPISNKIFMDNIKTNNPFFQYNKSDSKSIVQLQYVDTNNFYNTDSVTAFIYNHMELNRDELIKKLQYYFKLSESDATDVYDEKKNKMHLNISKKGKNIFAVRTYHTAVNIRINMMSDYSIKVNTNNTQDGVYQSLILYYLVHYLTERIENGKKQGTKKSPMTQDNEEVEVVNFNDLVDLDGADFDFDDISDIDSPKPNIETDISDYDEEILDDEESIDEEGLKESGKKTDYTTFVLDRLYKADKKLFLWKDVSTKLKNYSSKCGAVNYRQPVVINKEEIENIDKNHPGSYTGFVKTGSTPELKEKNYYICPKIWCRVSKVSITDDEYKKYGNKCPPPHGEEAIFFPKKGSKDNYFMTKDGTESHWPSLLNKNKHPKNLELPCCGKKPPKEDKTNNSNYVSNISTELLLNEGQYGNLPLLLNTILNKNIACVGILGSKKHCYARTGTDNSGNTLFHIIEKMLNIKSLGDYINENMLLEHYILLNGGNTLKVFMNNDDQFKLLDKATFKTFKTYFIENKEYVKKFNLQEEYKYLENIDNFELDDDSPLTRSIVREFLILQSFVNFKSYIDNDSINKQLEDIYHMLTFEWLNKDLINFIFLSINKDDVFFMNPKYYNFAASFNKTGLNVLILKIADGYEYVSYISQKKRPDSKELYLQYNTIKPIIENIDLKKQNDDDDILMSNVDVTKYILSTNLKCVGVVVNDKNVVMFGKNKMIEYGDLKTRSIVYMDKIGDYKMSRDVMKLYGKTFSDSDIESFKNNKMAENNLKLFVQDTNESSMEDNGEIIYNQNLYNVAKVVANKEKLANAVYVMNHSLSNFTMREKRHLLKKILAKNKINFSDEIVEERLYDDILRIPLQNILNDHKLKTHKKNKNEVYLSFNDLLNNKLWDHFTKYKRNQFTTFETSIDDFVEEINYIKLDSVENIELDGLKWSDLRKPIKPVKVNKYFPNFEVIDEEISYDKLINFANSLDKSLTLEHFEKVLVETIMAMYQSNKSELHNSFKRNINFEKHKITQAKSTLDDYVNLIKNMDYHYSLLELEILAKLIKHNIIIVGRDTILIDNGIHLISNNNIDKYIILMYNIHKNRHEFNLVIRNGVDDHIFTLNDFSSDLNKLLKLI
ncbi:hypothetical protein QKU58_gp038 [Pyramimonas orientalis virus]|uniref:Uncharacterized protein n=1 Tax=Pyramimonas orientalis virus 01B TaxID=3134525 RepID=A0A7M3UNM4_9VIRU|nr:hypothetical protein QKU58_gp038 [Pyramimonas orientalis virus]QOI90293.1 hypothetical protein HWQ62_00156 [Pyramimonas orientalis virus]